MYLRKFYPLISPFLVTVWVNPLKIDPPLEHNIDPIFKNRLWLTFKTGDSYA